MAISKVLFELHPERALASWSFSWSFEIDAWWSLTVANDWTGDGSHLVMSVVWVTQPIDTVHVITPHTIRHLQRAPFDTVKQWTFECSNWVVEHKADKAVNRRTLFNKRTSTLSKWLCPLLLLAPDWSESNDVLVWHFSNLFKLKCF